MSPRDPAAVTELLGVLRRTIRRRGLLKGGERLVLGVSGGADSLAMLHAMHRLAPELGLELHVAHFDHRLREDSHRDAAFVARQAARLGLPATVQAADATDPIAGASPEEAARIRRYRFLSETASAIDAARVATAHTLEDQAETVLMRILVGSGLRGLSGIPPRRWYTIRPMIDVRRAQVEAFCRSLRMRPRRDPSNLDLRFLRNLIRHDTIPHLERTVNARVIESLARLADIARDEDYYLDERASSLAAPEPADEGGLLSLETLRALPPALQRRAIRLLARNEGPGIDAPHTERVRELALAGETGKELHLPGSLRARVEYGSLVIGRAPSPAIPTEPVELDVPGETALPAWGLRVRAWIAPERPASWPDPGRAVVLDADRVPSPLRVRTWRAGDRFRPLGMARLKKLSDFFGDEKVPREQRRRVPLLVGRDDEVVWVVGYRLDDRVKTGSRTRRFLTIEVEGD